MESSATIRPARSSDAGAIARVHVRSWQSAYRDVFPARFLDGLRPEERAPMWERILADPDQATLVAEEDGSVVGFALVGPGRDEDEGVGELMAIYLLEEQWGRGIGRRLIAEAEEEMRRRGFGSAVLWVLDSNRRARAVYEACGWTDTGRVKSEPVFGVEATEAQYRKDL